MQNTRIGLLVMSLAFFFIGTTKPAFKFWGKTKQSAAPEAKKKVTGEPLYKKLGISSLLKAPKKTTDAPQKKWTIKRAIEGAKAKVRKVAIEKGLVNKTPDEVLKEREEYVKKTLKNSYGPQNSSYKKGYDEAVEKLKTKSMKEIAKEAPERLKKIGEEIEEIEKKVKKVVEREKKGEKISDEEITGTRALIQRGKDLQGEKKAWMNVKEAAEEGVREYKDALEKPREGFLGKQKRLVEENLKTQKQKIDEHLINVGSVLKTQKQKIEEKLASARKFLEEKFKKIQLDLKDLKRGKIVELGHPPESMAKEPRKSKKTVKLDLPNDPKEARAKLRDLEKEYTKRLDEASDKTDNAQREFLKSGPGKAEANDQKIKEAQELERDAKEQLKYIKQAKEAFEETFGEEKTITAVDTSKEGLENWDPGIE